MNLQNEAIELQKVFRKNYKTYWEETEAIKNHLESRFKELNFKNDNIQNLRVSLNGKEVKFKLKDNVITIENEMNISDSEQLICGICDKQTMHDVTLRDELHCLTCGNVANE